MTDLMARICLLGNHLIHNRREQNVHCITANCGVIDIYAARALSAEAMTIISDIATPFAVRIIIAPKYSVETTVVEPTKRRKLLI